MNKKTLLIFFILFSLVLTSCQIGPRAYNTVKTTNYFSGTDGLVVNFLDQAPPTEIFESSEFDIQLYIKNNGAFSLVDPFVVKIDLTYDNSKVNAIERSESDVFNVGELFNLPPLAENVHSNLISIEGKNANWPTGEEQYVYLDRFSSKKIYGNFQTSTTTFIAQLCYPYQTNFATEVCIDTDTEGISAREEVCEKQDYSFSKGQGAPIAITAVEVQMIPRGAYVQPQFTIHIEHQGDGTVSFTDVESGSYDSSQCNTIDRADVNKLSAQAFIGDDQLTCLPNDVILKGGKTKIQCQLIEDSILGVSSNYQTSLIVKLDYLYSESFRKDVLVRKSEGTIFIPNQPDVSVCPAWETYNGSGCVTNCETGARSSSRPEVFEGLEPAIDLALASELIAAGVTTDYFWNHVSCLYQNVVECKKSPEICLLQNDLCYPGSFCGLPSCVLKSYPPRVDKFQKIGLDKVIFYCVDSDDRANLKRTCGCIYEAYYGFLEKNSDLNCKDSAAYTQKSVGIYTIDGIKHEIIGLKEGDYKDKTLCIMVKDKLNKNNTKTSRYPFTH